MVQLVSSPVAPRRSLRSLRPSPCCSRATKVLAKDGFYEFWNWFDPTAWYPLGRVVGGTIYPGLMVTSGIIWNFLHWLNFPVDIREVCVMLAPAFAGLTAWATYL